jgi:cytochrome c oxidase accessory protein FixG
MEFVYRPIERFFEGTPGRAKKGWLQSSGVGTALKYATFLLVSLFLAHTFLSYFVGVDNLRMWMTRSPLEHPSSFLLVMLVTGAMMFDFAFFREQTCIVACPYGRLQSVLLDRKSLIVSYDRTRGEPRGKTSPRKAHDAGGDISLAVLEEPRVGDCVDCGMCVHTCPTGIDIRDGLQMECIHCAQCIDACDAVMDKLDRPRGLVRYASQAGLAGEKRGFLRARVVLYSLAFVIVSTLFLVMLSKTGVADVTILRGAGRPYYLTPQGEVANDLKVKLVNRLDQPTSFSVTCTYADEGVSIAPPVVTTTHAMPALLEPGESVTIPITLTVGKGAFDERGNRWITLTITSDSAKYPFRKTIRQRLVGPVPQ